MPSKNKELSIFQEKIIVKLLSYVVTTIKHVLIGIWKNDCSRRLEDMQS